MSAQYVHACDKTGRTGGMLGTSQKAPAGQSTHESVLPPTRVVDAPAPAASPAGHSAGAGCACQLGVHSCGASVQE